MCFFTASLFFNGKKLKSSTIPNYVGYVRAKWAKTGANLTIFDKIILSKLLREFQNCEKFKKSIFSHFVNMWWGVFGLVLINHFVCALCVESFRMSKGDKCKVLFFAFETYFHFLWREPARIWAGLLSASYRLLSSWNDVFIKLQTSTTSTTG